MSEGRSALQIINAKSDVVLVLVLILLLLFCSSGVHVFFRFFSLWKMRNKINDLNQVVGFMGSERDEQKMVMPAPMDPRIIARVRAEEAEMNKRGIVSDKGAGGSCVGVIIFWCR